MTTKPAARPVPVDATPPPGLGDDLGWLLASILRVYRQAADGAVADLPGGMRSFHVLAAAADGEPGSQLALAQRLGVDRTVMTYLLDDLQQAGLVERRPDPKDRRARRVVVTPAGSDRVAAVRRRLAEAEQHLLAPLEPAQRDTFRELVQRLACSAAPEGPAAGCVAASLEAEGC